ncbi:MAG: M15 family metallopeptidase [Egibacteraceae bacterium]
MPLLGTVRCHRDILPDMRAALRQVAEAGLSDEIDPGRYAGCFYPRRISTAAAQLSRHSWGIALDINVDLSLEAGGERPHPEIIAAFARHGFRWGGDFIVPDNHHFEWIGESG